MRLFRLAALLLLAATPVLAQEKPPMFPTRDVAVTYRVTGAQAQGGMPALTISWLSAQQSMRIDLGGMGHMIVDHRNQRGFMVVEAARMIMDVPMEQATRQYGPSANATFRRTGSDTVAGLPCTVWDFQDGPNSGTACMTAEGVMLRASGTNAGQSGGMEATRVAFGPQDPARFQRPQGFQSMQMPGQIPGQIPGQRPAPR